MSVWAVIPLKSPQLAKSRLGSVLDDSQRLRLFYLLAARVIGAALSTQGIDGVTVVTASDEVRKFATRLGAEYLQLALDQGTAVACNEALRYLPPRCRERVMFIAGDIPLVSPSALAPILATADRGPLITIAGDRRRIGTNVLLSSPGDIIPLCFGEGSFARHLSVAKQLGVTAHIVDSVSLALDIDEPDDLAEWKRLSVANGEPFDVEMRDLFPACEEVFSQ